MNIDRIQQTSKFDAKVTEGPCGVSVVWQPGNGTRYVFCFTHLGTLLENEGVPHDGILATVLNTRHGAVSLPFIGDGGVLHSSYVAEKVPALMVGNTRTDTFYAFLAVTNWMYGNESYGDECYRRMVSEFGFMSRL